MRLYERDRSDLSDRYPKLRVRGEEHAGREPARDALGLLFELLLEHGAEILVRRVGDDGSDVRMQSELLKYGAGAERHTEKRDPPLRVPARHDVIDRGGEIDYVMSRGYAEGR